MSKSDAKQLGTYKPKVSRSAVETLKTVIIAVLITGIIAFIGGVKYQQYQSDSVKSQAKSLAHDIALSKSKQ